MDDWGDIGMCRRGAFAGHWVLGASERSIGVGVHSDELFSWRWLFEPMPIEEGDEFERALTRNDAREMVRDWSVSWCPGDKVAAATRYLFAEETDWAVRRTFPTWDLVHDARAKMAHVRSGLHQDPMKIYSSAFLVYALAYISNEVSAKLPARGRVNLLAVQEVLDQAGMIVEMCSRRGALQNTPTSGVVDPAGLVPIGEESTPSVLLRTLNQNISQGMVAMRESDKCLAFTKFESPVENVLTPDRPWQSIPAWL